MEYIKTGNIISGVFKDGLDFNKPIKAQKEVGDWLLRGKANRCFNCKHYKQHFCEAKTASGNCFSAIYFGHCTASQRTKNVKPDSCCEKFETAWKG